MCGVSKELQIILVGMIRWKERIVLLSVASGVLLISDISVVHIRIAL